MTIRESEIFFFHDSEEIAFFVLLKDETGNIQVNIDATEYPKEGYRLLDYYSELIRGFSVDQAIEKLKQQNCNFY